MALHSGMRLGLLPPKEDPRIREMKAFLPAIPDPPDITKSDWTLAVAGYTIMCNDRLGCCTSATVGHALQTWGAYEGNELLMSDVDIERFYSATSGYIPGQPDTDKGAYMTDVLAYWAKTGVTVGDRTHKLDGYFKLPFDSTAIAQALQLCGPIAIGVSLTKGDMDNRVWGKPQPGESTSSEVEGGHAIVGVGCDADYVKYITWGQEKLSTWAWLLARIQEGYGLLSHSWVNAAGHNPAGWDWNQINALSASLK
jgi:hypothetical protein